MGEKPIFVLIEKCHEANWELRERYLIKKYDTKKNKLLNELTRFTWGPEIKIMFQNGKFFKKQILVNGELNICPVVKFENGQYWKLSEGKCTKSGYYYLSWSGRRFNISKKNNIYKLNINELPNLNNRYKIKTSF